MLFSQDVGDGEDVSNNKSKRGPGFLRKFRDNFNKGITGNTQGFK